MVAVCHLFYYKPVGTIYFWMAAWEKGYSLATRFRNTAPSVIISSFGLSLLLKTNFVWVAALAAFISIASKFLLRVRGKHIFNPSALAIVSSIVLTGKAWFSLGQWGSNYINIIWCLLPGHYCNPRGAKTGYQSCFLITFASLLFIRQVVYPRLAPGFFVQSISTGSLLLFSFFMITDPKTTPNHTAARIIWSMMVGGPFYVATFKFVNGAPVWVMVCLQPLVPLLDLVFRAKPFDWKPSSVQQQPSPAMSA